MRSFLQHGSRVACMALALLLFSGVAGAANELWEFSGKVTGVDSNRSRLTLRVPESGHPEGKQIIVHVRPETRLQGIKDVSQLHEGSPVRIRSQKSGLWGRWVAEQIVYTPAPKPSLAPVEKSRLHQIENEFAHGNMGDVEYETKRQVLAKN